MTDASILARTAAAQAKQGLPEIARANMEKSAQLGYPPALRALALWQIGGYGGRRDVEAGLAAIFSGAGNGDVDAMMLAARVSAEDLGGPRDFDRAGEYLISAANAGNVSAREQVAMLIGSHGLKHQVLENMGTGSASWHHVRSIVQWPHQRPLPPKRKEHANIIDADGLSGLLTQAECAYLIKRAEPYLKRALVVLGGGNTNQASDLRSNSVMFFGLQVSDVFVQSLDERICNAASIASENGEPLSILRYQPGETYAPHVDWFDAASSEVRENGQRTQTMLTYLNDSYSGGETKFIHAKWSYRGGTGDALTWRNVLPSGAVDPLTLHMGEPTNSGVKWLASKWFRSQPQHPRMQ